MPEATIDPKAAIQQLNDHNISYTVVDSEYKLKGAEEGLIILCDDSLEFTEEQFKLLIDLSGNGISIGMIHQ